MPLLPYCRKNDIYLTIYIMISNVILPKCSNSLWSYYGGWLLRWAILVSGSSRFRDLPLDSRFLNDSPQEELGLGSAGVRTGLCYFYIYIYTYNVKNMYIYIYIIQVYNTYIKIPMHIICIKK